MDFTGLNFVKTCEITYTYQSSTYASTTTDVLATSTEQCYSSAVAFNEILLATAVFFLIMFMGIKIFNLKNK